MIKEVQIRARIDKKMLNKYQQFCKKNSFVLSRRLRALIQMDMEGKIKHTCK
jgi:hypothetical protein